MSDEEKPDKRQAVSDRRKQDRRKQDRRDPAQVYTGPERRKHERREISDRRGSGDRRAD